MKDQVVMGPNGSLGIVIPLYRRHYEEELGRLEGCVVSFTSSNPIMYILDFGQEKLRAFDAKWVEKALEFLGDL